MSKSLIFSDATAAANHFSSEEEVVNLLVQQPERGLREIDVNETQQQHMMQHVQLRGMDGPVKRARRGDGRLKTRLRGGA